MKKRFSCSFFIFACISIASSQNIHSLKGKIIDQSSQKGIAGVHVFVLNDNQNGTVSNDNGSFVLKCETKPDEIMFSHLSYDIKRLPVQEKTETDMVVYLKANVITLNEITVRDFTAREIVRRTIENLEQNHYIEPSFYSFYSRIINYSNSTLHLLEEHTGYIKQDKSHNTKFALSKNRIKGFTELGKKLEENITMVRMTELYTDNIGKYREDYLRKGKFKKYQFKFAPDQKLFDRDCYVIEYSIDKSMYDNNGRLYIDKKNYGILKKEIIGKSKKEVTFIPINGKYYLKHSKYVRSFKGTKQEKITVYNQIEAAESIEFSSSVLITPKKSKTFNGNFNDEYWESINYIPLENWILDQINQSK